MQSVYAGTSGFSYKEWRGTFYPEDLGAKDFLEYYSQRLNAVEINNTFYRLPRKEVLRGWDEQTPDHFRFVIKASRRITHFKRLKEAEEPLGYLVTNTEVLGKKLGAVLFQLPPNLRCDVARLSDFVGLLPREFPAVMEFRHESWLCEEVFDILRSRNIPLCLADTEEQDALALKLPATASWCYARLRKPDYDKPSLKTWADYLAKGDFQSSMLMFKHEDAGAGPRLAESFLQSLSRRKTLKVAHPS